MASRIALVLALTSSLALAVVAGCGGGSGAALQLQPYPGDRAATPRRLESLARTFENTFACTEADTIQITGLAPSVYSVEGCTAIRDYSLSCRPGTSQYGPRELCEWQALPSLAQRAGADMNCSPDAVDLQPGGPSQRIAEGCGYRAVYMLNCGGPVCDWSLASRIEQVGPVTGGAPVQGSYVTQ